MKRRGVSYWTRQAPCEAARAASSSMSSGAPAGPTICKARASLRLRPRAGYSTRGQLIGIAFPGEPPEYRAARDRLLEREVELRRAMEAVAAARRELPPGGPLKLDYVFQGGPNGRPAGRRSALRAVQTRQRRAHHRQLHVSPRPRRSDAWTRDRETALLPLAEGPCPSCAALLDQLDGAAGHVSQHVNLAVVAKAPLPPCWRSPTSGDGATCSFSHRPATPTTSTTLPKRPTAYSGRC